MRWQQTSMTLVVFSLSPRQVAAPNLISFDGKLKLLCMYTVIDWILWLEK